MFSTFLGYFLEKMFGSMPDGEIQFKSTKTTKAAFSKMADAGNIYGPESSCCNPSTTAM